MEHEIEILPRGSQWPACLQDQYYNRDILPTQEHRASFIHIIDRWDPFSAPEAQIVIYI